LSEILAQKKAIGLDIDASAETTLVEKASKLTGSMVKKIDALDEIVVKAQGIEDAQKQADFYQSKVIEAMESLRAAADELEAMVGEKYWPYPIYEDLLFYV